MIGPWPQTRRVAGATVRDRGFKYVFSLISLLSHFCYVQSTRRPTNTTTSLDATARASRVAKRRRNWQLGVSPSRDSQARLDPGRGGEIPPSASYRPYPPTSSIVLRTRTGGSHFCPRHTNTLREPESCKRTTGTLPGADDAPSLINYVVSFNVYLRSE